MALVPGIRSRPRCLRAIAGACLVAAWGCGPAVEFDSLRLVKLRGKQPLLEPVGLPVDVPVTAQLVASTANCWQADHATFVTKNTSAEFSAQNDAPTSP